MSITRKYAVFDVKLNQLQISIREPDKPYTVASYDDKDDFDGAWKAALEKYIYEFLQLLAPNIYSQINTKKSPKFLDKELQNIFNKSKLGTRFADKLIEVRLKHNAKALLLIHIEVQSKVNSKRSQSKLARRMYHYYTLINSHFNGSDVFSIGVLLNSRGGKLNIVPDMQGKRFAGDDSDSAATGLDVADCLDGQSTLYAVPDYLEYKKEVFGNTLVYKFQVIHLAKWRSKIKHLELLANTNPFAIIVLSQLYAVPNKNKRLNRKKQMIRLLSEYGYSKIEKHFILNLIDWIIKLPTDIQPDFLDWVDSQDEETKMEYVNSIAIGFEERGMKKGEKIGEAKGLEIGLITGQSNLLIGQLEKRFGDLPGQIIDTVKNGSLEQIQVWSLKLLDAKTLDEVFTE